MKKLSKKDIILEMFYQCSKNNNFVFDNSFVKNILKLSNSNTNPYDMTKIDSLNKLPDELVKQNVSIIHHGDGVHEFIFNANQYIYHDFAKIDNVINWQYRPSILNNFSSSENAILSLCFNQKIIHDFLYNDPHNANPKMYNAERKRGISFDYEVNGVKKQMKSLQIEIDLTTEKDGFVTVFEGKNIKDNKIENFNVFQIYNPFRYYYDLKIANKLDIKEINCCYLVQDKNALSTKINIYLYTFTNYKDISSVKLLKSASYVLNKK
jgi:hypothetical protein